ncbi:MAG: NUDIX domain-containing protein [Actinomycetaceae bacterium]|nr:NUDIX domain-containing protein [Actinomycetaceae bacterium]
MRRYGWVIDMEDRRHWGPDGAAGLLLVARADGVDHALLQLRSAWTMSPNVWGIPGGAVEENEDPTVAAVREAEEEAGVKVADFEVLSSQVTAVVPIKSQVYRWRTPEGEGFTDEGGRWYIEQINNRHGTWTYTTVIARASHLLPTVINEESVELRWVPLDSVPDLPLLGSFAKAWPRLRAQIDAQG